MTPFPLYTLLMAAMDRTQPAVEAALRALRPHLVFLDFTHWLPPVCRRLGIKSVHYCTISSVSAGYLLSPERKILEKGLTETDLLEPPKGFPPPFIKLHAHEARELAAATVKEFGIGVSFVERLLMSLSECDAIALRACREIEGPYCDYLETQFRKPVILAGPVVPEPPNDVLEERWAKFLDGFEAGSVIFCAFGSECVLKRDQFQEMILGLELTGKPFVAALKPPAGAGSVESALPEGFEERVQGTGVVHGGWVQQQLILGHPSVGCFVTHCGSGSLSEALVNRCQLVLVPHVGDQIINARMMSVDLRVGVEVAKGEEDGLFRREGVCEAIRCVMDEGSEVGREMRANHDKWRGFLLDKGLEDSYMDGFFERLQSLLG